MTCRKHQSGATQLALPFLLFLSGCQPEHLSPPQCELAPEESAGTSWKAIGSTLYVFATDGDEILALDSACTYCSLYVLDAASGTWQEESVFMHDKLLESGSALASPQFLYADFTAAGEHVSHNEHISLLYDREESSWSIIESPEGPDPRHYDFRHQSDTAFLFWGDTDYDERRDHYSDSPGVRHYDGILLDATTGQWRDIPPARESDEFGGETGSRNPWVESVWTTAGLFVWGSDREHNEKWGAIFDVETMTWEHLEVDEDAPPHASELFSIGDDVFLTSARAMWRFSLSQRTWTEVDVPQWADPRYGTVIRDSLAFTGRCLGGELYHPKSDTWKPLAIDGVRFNYGVPRAAGDFLTVTNENDHHDSSKLWILDLSDEFAD